MTMWLRRTLCPYCGAVRDTTASATEGVDHLPEDGDVSICWECRRPAVYVVGALGVAVRGLSPEEEAEVMGDPIVRRALGAAAESYQLTEALRLLGTL